MEPTNDEIKALGGGAWDLVSATILDIVKNIVRPQYAAVLETQGKDYKMLFLLHCGHVLYLYLAMIAKAAKPGQADVTSASAGEVSVSFGALGVNPADPNSFGLTIWGQELQRLRKAQGPFVAGGGSVPPFQFRM